MHRKLTYIKHEYESELVQIEEFDNNNQLTYIKEINREGTIESRFEFDSNDNVTQEINYLDGILSDKSEYLFDKEGDLLSHKLIIEDEIVEETKREAKDLHSTETMWQNGEEVKKIISEYKDGESTKMIYEMGDLAEKKISKESQEHTKSIVYSPDNTILYYENYFYDENDQIVKHEILTPTKEIISVENYKYKNKNLTEISFSSDQDINSQKYSRDKNNNLIKFEITDENGMLVHLTDSIFDSENREIEKIVFSNGSKNLFEMKYEKIS
jgi:hypothetical protein